MKQLIIHNKRHILFALLLFIATQYSAVVHASAHYFHTPDSSCLALNVIEHSVSGIISHQILVPDVPLITHVYAAGNFVKPVAYYIFLPSRAPPLL